MQNEKRRRKCQNHFGLKWGCFSNVLPALVSRCEELMGFIWSDYYYFFFTFELVLYCVKETNFCFITDVDGF